MLRRCFVVVAALLSCIGARVAPAAPFVNLDFEQATILPGTPPGFVNASAAFPGWTARIGNDVQSSVAFNFTGIGEGQVVLYDRFLGLGVAVIQPTFSACLITDAGFDAVASLSQLGDVPVGAMSLRFFADFFLPPAFLQVNGSGVALTRLSDPQIIAPVEWGADISAFAGQSVELRFTSGPLLSARVVTVDAISFSPLPIPEPSAGAALVWVTLLGLRVRRCDRDLANRNQEDERCVALKGT